MATKPALTKPSRSDIRTIQPITGFPALTPIQQEVAQANPGSIDPGYSAPPFYKPLPQADDDPTQDPAFLAFQRALGLSEQNMQADIAAQVARRQSEVSSLLPQLDQQRSTGVNHIALSHSGHGTWSSSARLRDQNEFGAQVDQKKADAVSGLASYQGDLQGSLARSVAQNQARLAEEALSATGRVSGAHAKAEADHRASYDAAQGAAQRAELERQAALTPYQRAIEAARKKPTPTVPRRWLK